MSSSSRVSEFRSIIHSTFSRLRSSFRAADFDEAEQKLLSIEEKVECSMLNLREERDFFESELSGSRLEEVKLKADLSKLERECQINDGKMSDLGRDLSLAREKEVAAHKRYGKLFDDIRIIEHEKDELIEERQREQSLHGQKLMDLNNELADLRRNLRRKDVENDEIRAKNGFLEKKIEEGKRESDGHLEERIVELEEKNKILEMEKSEILRQNEGLRGEVVKMEEMEKRVLKLERSLASWFSNFPRDKVLANAEVDKIMCFIDSGGLGGRADRVFATNVIQIESDDDDDDDDLPLHEVKKRSLKKRAEDEDKGSSEDNLNPKNKPKKLNDLDHETFKHGASVSAFRKCNEKLREGSIGEDNQTSTEATIFSNPRVEDLLATCRRSKPINLE